jgi:hypothetical protein
MSSISNTNAKIWVNDIPTHLIVITHYVHQQSNAFIIFVNVLILHCFHPKTHFLVVKCIHYEDNKKDNTHIKMANLGQI